MDHGTTCSNCGRKIEDGWKFCPDCSTPVDLLIPTEQWKLFSKETGGKFEYLYGPEYQAMALLVDGGYPTPEEAKRVWLQEYEHKKK